MKKILMMGALMMGTAAIAQTTQPSGQTVDDPAMSTGPQGVTQQNTDPNGQATPPAGYNQSMTNSQGRAATGQTQRQINGMDHSGMDHSRQSMGTQPQGNANGYQGAMQGQGNNMGQGNAMGQTGSMGYQGRGGPEAGGAYPPCSRTVTDSCVQTYERGVRRSRR